MTEGRYKKKRKQQTTVHFTKDELKRLAADPDVWDRFEEMIPKRTIDGKCVHGWSSCKAFGRVIDRMGNNNVNSQLCEKCFCPGEVVASELFDPKKHVGSGSHRPECCPKCLELQHFCCGRLLQGDTLLHMDTMLRVVADSDDVKWTAGAGGVMTSVSLDETEVKVACIVAISCRIYSEPQRVARRPPLFWLWCG